MSTDLEWERWGKNDPYFGVITDERFRSENLTEDARKEFFKTGEVHVNHVMKFCRHHLGQDFTPRRILDFGCGTGRLVIPFAKIGEEIVGVDVSDSMLKEAGKNCKQYAVENVTLLKSDDDISTLGGGFDLIHSFIVFQHIPIERGINIFKKLLERLNAGGVCAIQFTYSKHVYENDQGLPPVIKPIKKVFNQAIAIFRKKGFDIIPRKASQSGQHSDHPKQDAEMQMNPYNLNTLYFAMQSAGIQKVSFEFTDHGGELGIFMCFQKPNSPAEPIGSSAEREPVEWVFPHLSDTQA